MTTAAQLLTRASIVSETPLTTYVPLIKSWSIHGAPVPKWSTKVAKERVRFHIMFQATGTSEPYVLLGRHVAAAFGLPSDAEWFEWFVVGWHNHAMIPVPLIGRKAEYERLLRELSQGELPRSGHTPIKEDA